MYNIWLLVAGGCYGGNLATVELFNTPAACNHGSGVVLPSGDLLVTGGQDSSLKLTSQVDVASVLNLCLIPKPHVAGLGMRFVSILFCLHSDHL